MHAEQIARIFISILGWYFGAGLVFAMAFVMRGVQAVDESARGASMGFRVIIIPGVCVFWPWLLTKWIRTTGRQGQIKNSHE